MLVVTNFASHYRAPLYELLHERLGAEFVFFSRGGEGYWQPHLGTTEGSFPSVTAVGGPRLGKLRFNTRLWRHLRTRRYDVMIKCMNGRLELPMAYLAARLQGASFVLWTGMWMHPDSAFHRMSRPLARWIYRHADAVITYGSHVSAFVVAEGADPERVFAADNATDNMAFGRHVKESEIAAVRASCGIANGDMVLAVSRLVEEKGLDVLVEAVASLDPPRPTLVVVGTGPLDADLRLRAQEHGVSLHLAGGLRPHQLPPYYAAADVFVMPSVTTSTFKETWGLACNEAMLQATPIIATAAVGAAAGDLVEDGVTGLVVPEGDARALREALQRLLSEAVLRVRLGDAGRARVAGVDYQRMAAAFASAVESASQRRWSRR